MYAGVPTTAPAMVSSPSTLACGDDGSSTSWAPSIGRTRPKSVTQTRPSLPMRTLSGLKSRCTRPAACAAASPAPGRREDAQDLLDRARARRLPRGQRRAVDDLHGDEQAIVPGADVEDGDDVGMADARHRLRLAHQPRAQLDVELGELRAHQLERHLALQLRIERAVDDAHAAGAEHLEHAIAPDAFAGAEAGHVALARLTREGRRRGGPARV